MSDHGFSKECPSGNHFIDGHYPLSSYFIENYSDLRNYIREHISGRDIRAWIEEFNSKGYIEIERD